MKKMISLFLALVLTLALVTSVFADTITIPSGPGTSTVYGPLPNYAPLGDITWGTGVPAVATWKHSSWPTIGGSTAVWISNTYQIDQYIPDNSWRLFKTTTPLCSGAYNIAVTVTATADNAEEVYANGTLVGFDGEVQGAFTDNQEWKTLQTYSYSIAKADEVVIDFIVRNYSGVNSPTSNPTGLLYEIGITYSCPTVVDIDIKPGSYPSCFNNDGSGVIPVAINGSATFDVTTVNPGTVTLAGLAVAAKGKSDKLMAAYEDWNMDGYMDLVLKIVDSDGTFDQGSGTAMIEGFLNNGTPIIGTGDICITQ